MIPFILAAIGGAFIGSALKKEEYGYGGGMNGSGQSKIGTYDGVNAVKGNVLKHYTAPNGTNVEFASCNDDDSRGEYFAIAINGRGIWASSDKDKASKAYDEEIEKYKQTYAEGGYISNQYIGKTPERIWDEWTIQQRKHFLNDHNKQLSSSNRINEEKINQICKDDYDQLGMMIVSWLDSHISEGQYADGGTMAKGGTTFAVGQSVILQPTNTYKLDKSVKKIFNKYDNIELVIEKIETDTPYNTARAFVKDSGEKVPFDLILNPRYIKQYPKGGMVAEKIKDWYTKTYPTDDLGEELNDDVTFTDLWNGIHKKNTDVYEIMGVGDSLIRERLFGHLSEIKGVDYDYIYTKWLESDYADGSTMAKGGTIDSAVKQLWEGYAEAVIFTEEEQNEWDGEYSIYDFDKQTETKTKKLLANYYKNNKKAIEESGLDLSTIGNDIWYTISGQGAGFFDHNLDEDIEEQLTEAAEAMLTYGEVYAHNGKIVVR